MKLKNYCSFAFLCVLLVCTTSCDKEIQNEEKIPAAIQTDFTKRLPLAKITASYSYSNGLQQLDFVDEAQNQGQICYIDAVWKMTYSVLKDIHQLPDEVRKTFANSPYADAQILDIYKTEREGINHPLYTLHFRYTRNNTNNVEHYVFINEDGLFLETLTWTPNDPRWFVALSDDHFKFIAEKYKGAEIRGFINNMGDYEYFILHENTIKYVFFREEQASEYGFWRETRYELPRDTDILMNVAKELKQTNPDFTYTNLYYIESAQGNRYLFEDRNRDNDLGYYIYEHCMPS